MTTNQQKVRVKVADLIVRIKAAKTKDHERLQRIQLKAKQDKDDKIAQLRKEADRYDKMSVDDFMLHDYRYDRQKRDYDKQIAILEIAADEIITIDAGSDLAAYL